MHVRHDPIHLVSCLLHQVRICLQCLFDRAVSQVLAQGNDVDAVVDRVGGKTVPQIVQSDAFDACLRCGFV